MNGLWGASKTSGVARTAARLKRLAWALISAGTALTVPAPASAEVDCSGFVTDLSLQLTSVGTVTLSLSGGPTYVYLCDIAGSGRNSVEPTVCKAMYTTLLAAKATSKKVLVRFYDYDSCSAIPAWVNAGSLGYTRVLID